MPPPRQAPSITATVGTGSALIRSNSACTRTLSAVAAAASGSASNSPMSAPAMKQLGVALRTSTSRTGSPAASAATWALMSLRASSATERVAEGAACLRHAWCTKPGDAAPKRLAGNGMEVVEAHHAVGGHSVPLLSLIHI